MARKASWPPKVYPNNRDGTERMSVTIDGKRKEITLGKIGSPEAKAEYQRQLAILLANGGRYPSAAPTPNEALVVDVTIAFLEAAEREHGADWGQFPKYQSAFRPLLAIHGKQPAKVFDADALDALRRIMAAGTWMTEEEKADYEKRKLPIGWARSVINQRITLIKATWAWAERKKMIPAGSYANLLTVKSVRGKATWCRETPARDATSRADLDKVLPHCPAPVAAMLELQWWSGMRSGEVRMMKLGNIDRSGKVWLYLPDVDKNAWRGDPTPPVALGPECRKILAPWIAAAPSDDAYLFRPLVSRMGKRNDALIAGPDCCYSERAYPQAVDRACTRAGVKIIPYGGRHATKMRITRNVGADAARAVLRQKSIISTTHYGAIDTEHATEVMSRLG